MRTDMVKCWGCGSVKPERGMCSTCEGRRDLTAERAQAVSEAGSKEPYWSAEYGCVIGDLGRARASTFGADTLYRLSNGWIAERTVDGLPVRAYGTSYPVAFGELRAAVARLEELKAEAQRRLAAKRYAGKSLSFSPEYIRETREQIASEWKVWLGMDFGAGDSTVVGVHQGKSESHRLVAIRAAWDAGKADAERIARSGLGISPQFVRPADVSSGAVDPERVSVTTEPVPPRPGNVTTQSLRDVLDGQPHHGVLTRHPKTGSLVWASGGGRHCVACTTGLIFMDLDWETAMRMWRGEYACPTTPQNLARRTE